MRAFVTGATGLLGSNLVQMLVAQGYNVRALVRSREKAQRQLRNARVELIEGDMQNIPAFADALADCDVLFHTAAYFREYYGRGGDHWTALERINVRGTIDLLNEAERRGVKRTVYVSSSGVIGRTIQPIGDETTPPDHLIMRNLYFRSKVLAEKTVTGWLTTHKMPVVFILPTVMLGPQDAGPTGIGGVVINVLKGKMPVIPPGGFEMVDVRDVAQGMINAVTRGRGGERYIMSKRYVPLWEFTQIVATAAGVKAPGMRLSVPAAYSVAMLSEIGARLTGSTPLLPIAAVQSMLATGALTAAKAERELEVTFRPIEESIRDEAAWFRANGYVGIPAERAIPAV